MAVRGCFQRGGERFGAGYISRVRECTDALEEGIFDWHFGCHDFGVASLVESGLEQRLKDRGIKTVIVTGTSAQGAVIGVSSGAAQRGYQVIVPVDGMSAEDPYNEQYAAWHLYKGGPTIITDKITLTRSDMIKF